jgi:hypothetical protein
MVLIVAVGLESIVLSIFFSGLFLQTELFEEEWYESIESVILAATGVFSLLLLALSILAYRRTGLKKIIFAAIAFSLFAIQLILESLEESFGVLLSNSKKEQLNSYSGQVKCDNWLT